MLRQVMHDYHYLSYVDDNGKSHATQFIAEADTSNFYIKSIHARLFNSICETNIHAEYHELAILVVVFFIYVIFHLLNEIHNRFKGLCILFTI
jgi:hypothetical protein